MGLFARDTNQLLAMKGNMPCPSQAVPEPGQEPKVFIDPPFLIHSGEETLAISYKIDRGAQTLPYPPIKWRQCSLFGFYEKSHKWL